MLLAYALALATALSAGPRYDTVHLANGGRLRGTVVADTPSEVMIELPDGSVRRFSRSEVVRIVYGDDAAAAAQGATAPPAPTVYGATPPPPPPFAPEAPPPPPPAAIPAPAAPEPRHPKESTGFQMALALEGLGPYGQLTRDGSDLNELVQGEVGLALEVGGKPTPGVFLGVMVEGAAGHPGTRYRGACNDSFNDCVATTARAGGLVRWYFRPGASRTGWLAVGSGVEYTSSTVYDRGTTVKRGEITATGWEILRVSLGVDWRLSEGIGLGLYGVGSVASFSHIENTTTGVDSSLHPIDTSGTSTTHGWVGGGVRMVIFP